MTSISMAGVALGVATLVTVLSIMGGFGRDLKAKIFQGIPHLELKSNPAMLGFSVKDLDLSLLKSKYPMIERIEFFTSNDVVIKHRNNLAMVTVFGIEKDKSAIWGFKEAVLEGSMDALHPALLIDQKLTFHPHTPRITLGEGLASQLMANVSDEIHVLSPRMGVDEVLSGGQISNKYIVGGIFMTGLNQYDQKYSVVDISQGRLYMPEYDMSLEHDQYVNGIAINIKDPEKIDLLKSSLLKDSSFQNLSITSWKDVNAAHLFALQLEKYTMGAILLLIVVVAAFSISGTMMMTVYYKRSQAALLRALGMSKKDIYLLFLTQGCVIGTTGVFVGMILGLGLCVAFSNFSFMNMLAQVYHLQELPVKYLPFEYVLIASTSWSFCLMASIYPAKTAAKQEPGIGLRYL